jgi:3',5'-cyclic AMP phosphodiesterase CpdA
VASFFLAHLTDPHLTPPHIAWGWRDAISKRALSRGSWRRRRRFAHRREVLDAIVADIEAARPDHIAITGDVTNLAADEEFAAARAWFASLGPTGAVTVSPGNHDALVPWGQAARFASWRPWFGDGEGGAFPYLRRREGVALINLSSARPTAPLLASGRLGPEQLDRLAGILDQAKAEGLARVVLIHHPPADPAMSPRKALNDGPALCEVLRRHGAELVLHGHASHPRPVLLPGPEGGIPVVGVSSASARSHGNPQARWHGYRIETEGGAVRIELTVRGFREDGDTVVELERRPLKPLSSPAAAP